MISRGNFIENPEQNYLITTSQVPRMNFHNAIVGRRISHSLELTPKPNHILRPNISTETLKKRLKNQAFQGKATSQSTLLHILQEASFRQIEDDNPNKTKDKNNVKNSNQFDIIAIAQQQTANRKNQQFKVIRREISQQQINLRSRQIIENKSNPKKQIAISYPICLHKSSQLPKKSNSYVFKTKKAKRRATERNCQTISAKKYQTLGKCNTNNNSRKCVSSKKESNKICQQGLFKRQKNKVSKQKVNKLGKSLRITGQNYLHSDKFKLCFGQASHRNRSKTFTQNLDFQQTEKKVSEKINSNTLHRFHHAASIIQKFWRSHFIRLKLAKNKLPSFTKEYIEDIWDDDHNNSIIKGDTDSQSISESQISQNQKKQEEKDEHLIEKPGFDTTLQFVQDYCQSFCKFITSSHRHRIQLLKKLEQITDCSIQQGSGIDRLKFARYSLKNKNIQIFSKSSFQEFNSSQQGVNLFTEQLEKDLNLLQWHQYFLSSLFDAFNETLSPYPYPYKHSKLNEILKKQNNNKQLKNNQISQYICSYSMSKILQWSSSLCGFIPESLDKDKVIDISEQQLKYIRECRLALMLKTYILQNQPEMLDYGDQQHTINIKEELSNKIALLLFQQIFSQYEIYK